MRSSLIRNVSVASAVLAMSFVMCMLKLGPEAHAQEEGQAAFRESGCARCHSVEAAGIEATVSERMRGPDLGAIGTEHDAAWVVSVVRQTTELDDGSHRAKFRGTDDQLSALAAWLVGLE